jgi:hypothetical protein
MNVDRLKSGGRCNLRLTVPAKDGALRIIGCQHRKAGTSRLSRSRSESRAEEGNSGTYAAR